MAWTTFDTRYESAGVHLFDDEDSKNDHLPKDDSRKDWWKQLPEEERSTTPEPAWTIPFSNVSDVENNWATALVSFYETPGENSLLAKNGDMMNFMNWYWRQVKKIKLTQADLKGQAYEVDWTNLERDQVRVDVNRPLPLGGPPCHVTIQTQLFLNKDLEYLRYGSKGNSLTLSISKMKAASYPDFGLELLVPEKMWINDVCTYGIKVRSHMRILSVIRIKAYSRYGYDYLSKIILQRADIQEHMISRKDFKNLYPSGFKDLNLLLLQGYEFRYDYTIIESPRAVVFPVNNNERKIMRFNEIYKFSDGTLTWILEALAYRVKEFKIKRLNLENEMISSFHLNVPYHVYYIVDSTELASPDDDASEVDEGVPAELTRTGTVRAGETGLSTQGGSRRQKCRSGSCTELHMSYWLRQLIELDVNSFHDT
nr:hypothetical protein [Tanacetum cinerariifolium]